MGTENDNSQDSMLRRLSPFVRLAHDRRTPVMVLPPRRINDHALLYFKFVTGWFRVEDEKYEVAPHSLFFIRPDVDHEFECAEHPQNRMLNLHFDLVEHERRRSLHFSDPPFEPAPPEEQLPDAPRASGGLPSFLGVLAHAQTYEALFFRVHRTYVSRGPTSALRAKAAMLDLLAWLIEDKAPLPADAEDAIQRAIVFMRDHLAEPLSVESIAEAVHMSRASFARHFRAHYQATPMRVLQRLRLENARAALLDSDAPVKTIAAESGFASLHHFSRLFREFSGQSPAAFRHSR